MTHCEVLYGRSSSLIRWFDVGEEGLIGQDLVHQAMDKVNVIQVMFKMAH